jgi:hypothetical protein
LRNRARDVDESVDSAEFLERAGDDDVGRVGVAEIEIQIIVLQPLDPPFELTREAVSSSILRFLATKTMEEKSCASRTAVARPMPWLAPVMMATELILI